MQCLEGFSNERLDVDRYSPLGFGGDLALQHFPVAHFSPVRTQNEFPAPVLCGLIYLRIQLMSSPLIHLIGLHNTYVLVKFSKDVMGICLHVIWHSFLTSDLTYPKANSLHKFITNLGARILKISWKDIPKHLNNESHALKYWCVF